MPETPPAQPSREAGRASASPPLRDGAEDPHFDAARDLDMRQHRQRGEQALDDHAHVRARIRRGDEHEALAGVEMLAHRLRRLVAELFQQAGIDVEFADVALGVALQRLVESEVPAIAEPQNLEHAGLRQVAAYLLRHADADMLD